MENSVFGGGLLSRPSGILDLETAIHRHQQHHAPQNPHSHLHHFHPISAFANDDAGQKLFPASSAKGKGISIASHNCTSDEDEPSFAEDSNELQLKGMKGKKVSLWHRMKWTDSMVRLLIAAVSCVGEDVSPESNERLKRKPGFLQKKGKWKTISKMMMEKGCYVSPQQCEDKFNDLNKRYKRLNEILGKGTTCRVVENPLLLESMTHLSPKMKDDVRKTLNSKHLFYKEMCAYHNVQRLPMSHDLDMHGCSMPILSLRSSGDEFEEEEEEENEDDDAEDYVDNEDEVNGDEYVERVTDFRNQKKANERDTSLWPPSGGTDCFEAEMTGMLQDATKSPWDQKEWIRNRTLQLLEQRVSYQAQEFELEKRRFKWQRFCSKKDRELERLKLENERMRLENERMALQVKQKELEIDTRKLEGLIDPIALGVDRNQERDRSDSGRVQ